MNRNAARRIRVGITAAKKNETLPAGDRLAERAYFRTSAALIARQGVKR